MENSLKGSITAGKLADFVVLSVDPHAVDPDHINEIQVVRTVVGGFGASVAEPWLFSMAHVASIS
jgi:predicted amidohydrolase YtcJ